MNTSPAPNSPRTDLGIESARSFKLKWYERVKRLYETQFAYFTCAVNDAIHVSLSLNPPKREIIICLSIDCVETLGFDLLNEILIEAGYRVRDVRRDETQVHVVASVPFTIENEMRPNAPT